MRNLKRITAFAIGLCIAPATGHAADVYVRGSIEPEVQYFIEDGSEPQQSNYNASIAGELVYDYYSDDGNHHFGFELFGRADLKDSARSHFDFRQAKYQYIKDEFELTVGLERIYWGVTEAAHLVDVINQTDGLEGVDGEDKLGQPLVRLSYAADWGTLSVFVLPYFRERNFPGLDGRPRIDIPIAEGMATFESGAEEKHIDWAARYSVVAGDFDIGISHFSGTQRDPVMTPLVLFKGKPFTPPPPPTATPADFSVVLVPHYPLMEQTALDIQATKGSWLLKFEGFTRRAMSDRHIQATGGIEYSFYGVFDTDGDLGIVAEYIWDERGDAGGNPFQNDVFIGLRWTANDVDSTAVLAGGAIDLDSQATFASVEAEKRFGDNVKLSVEARMFFNFKTTDPLWMVSDDGFVQARLGWYF